MKMRKISNSSECKFRKFLKARTTTIIIIIIRSKSSQSVSSFNIYRSALFAWIMASKILINLSLTYAMTTNEDVSLIQTCLHADTDRAKNEREGERESNQIVRLKTIYKEIGKQSSTMISVALFLSLSSPYQQPFHENVL